MKRAIAFTVVVMMAIAAKAQDNAITKYFSNYLEDTSYTKVTVTSKMFSLFTEIDAEDEAEKELLDAMGKLKGIKAIVGEDVKNPSTQYRNAVAKLAKDKSYEELMSIEDADENVRFMIKDKGGIINELLMVVGGKQEFMVMTLYGEIDLNQIGRLSRIMKVDGLEHLRMLDGGSKMKMKYKDKDKDKDKDKEGKKD